MRKATILAALLAFGAFTLQSFVPVQNPALMTAETSQNPIQEGFTAEEIAQANTAANTSLQQIDKDIILYCNLARMDGARFWNNYAIPFLGSKSTRNTLSLRNDLAQIGGLPMLYPDKGLCAAAAAHASDMGQNNFFDHSSHDGTNCFDRVRKYYNSYQMAENIAAGNNDALAIVMQWLVDEHTPSLGHRKNILNSELNAIGVCSGAHRTWGTISVQDFGDKVITKMQ